MYGGLYRYDTTKFHLCLLCIILYCFTYLMSSEELALCKEETYMKVTKKVKEQYIYRR